MFPSTFTIHPPSGNVMILLDTFMTKSAGHVALILQSPQTSNGLTTLPAVTGDDVSVKQRFHSRECPLSSASDLPFTK